MSLIETKMNHEKELHIEIGNYRATLTQSSESSHSTDVPCLTPKTAVVLMDEIKIFLRFQQIMIIYTVLPVMVKQRLGFLESTTITLVALICTGL